MISFLQVENLTKTYGETILFRNISFSVNKDEKIALIAKNGTGKTSLLNIIAGIDTSDEGKVSYRRDISMGYLQQDPKLDDNKTVIEQVFDHTSSISEAITLYEKALISGNQELLNKATAIMDTEQAWDFEVKVKQILEKLKLNNFEQKIGQLSGGQKKRVALAATLINEPDLLILDEPTNHLDMEMIDWLETFLAKTRSTLLMVTHDRYFLDRVCNEIIEMDNNTIYTYRGNYSYYLEKREERISATNATIERAANLLRKEREWIVRQPSARATKAKYRVENFYKLKETARQKLQDDKLDLQVKTSRLGKKVLELKKISKNFDSKKILDEFSHSFIKGEKIGIVGNNGVGKTTFLNMLTGSIPIDSGIIDLGQTVVFGYYTQQGIDIKNGQRVIDVIKDIAEIITLGNGKVFTASQFLEMFLFPPEIQYAVVEKLSGGERRRLYLMTVLMKNPNFLILDEPTNDLDIMTLNVLEDYLTSFSGCVLLVSHDRYFVDKIVDYLFVFEGEGQVLNFPGNYSDYQYDMQERLKEIKNQETKPKVQRQKSENTNQRKLSFNEKREFEQLEKEIENLNREKNQLEDLINSGTLKSDELITKSKRLSEIMESIDEKEFRWLELSEMY